MQPEQLTADQLTMIEKCWRKRPAPVYLYDHDRGLINATVDVLALVEALRQAWREVEELRRQLPGRQGARLG